MSPKTKTTEFPAVRVSEKLKGETAKAAELEQENLSEYIRKAVEERNKRVLKGR
jgi:predicted HicB family RNase H-like nuclease